MESLGKNPAPAILTGQNTEGDKQTDTPTDEQPKINLLFLCYKCQSHIPYITNLKTNASGCVITGHCPCGFFFIEELFFYMRKVYAIKTKENKFNFPTYYNCKKHNKYLNGICKDCEILICDDCVKEDHHIKEEFKKGQFISKKNYDFYTQMHEQFKRNLDKYFPDLIKDNDTHEYLKTFLLKVEGQFNLIRSLRYTYFLYKDNPQLMHNFYYVQFLHQGKYPDVSKLTKDTLISFFVLFSVIEPFEELILRSNGLPMENKQGITCSLWEDEGVLIISYKKQFYRVSYDNNIYIIKKMYNDEEQTSSYCLSNDNIFIGDNLEEYTDTGIGKLIDTFGNCYEGEFENKQKNGYGILNIRNVYTLSGKWENDLKNGKGKCEFIDKYQTAYTTQLIFEEDKIVDKYKSVQEKEGEV